MSASSTELRELVIAAREHRPGAFEELPARFQGFGLSLAVSRLADPDLARDAVQESFLDVHLQLGELQEPEAFASWFRRIVIKHCDRLARRIRPMAHAFLTNRSCWPSPSADAPACECLEKRPSPAPSSYWMARPMRYESTACAGPATSGHWFSNPPPVQNDAMEPLDLALARFAATSPIVPPGLSNHGPMVVEVLDHLGRRDVIACWTDKYVPMLVATPQPMRRIEPSDWAAALGDHARLGDWLDFFKQQVQVMHWEHMLRAWLPRLMPGIKTELGHGPIRTFHAARALRRAENAARLRELAMALGFWAAWYEESPSCNAGTAAAGEAETAIDTLTEAGAKWFLQGMDLEPPVVLAHAVTIPRAIRELLPWLEDDERRRAASLVADAYAGLGYGHPDQLAPPTIQSDPSFGQLLDEAVANGDPHAIKFTEACQEQHERTGSAIYLVAANAACTRLVTQSALFG